MRRPTTNFRPEAHGGLQPEVRVIGGPLGGNAYEISGNEGDTIELNSPAGMYVYRFAKDRGASQF